MSYCQAQEFFATPSGLSYSGQKDACADKGRRLCTLEELCPSRGNYNSPFNKKFTPSFDFPSNYPGGSYWVAYETTDGDGGNCENLGGCNGNSWIVENPDTAFQWSCNTYCEFFDGIAQGQCPPWGSVGKFPNSNNYVCCDGDTTAEVS